MAVAEVNGNIYIVGGYPTSPSATVNTVQVYDLASNTWSTGPVHPIPMHHPVAVGVTGSSTASAASSRRAIPTERSFSTRRQRPVADLRRCRPRAAQAPAAVIGDKIYVVGGRPPAGNAFEAYDISDNAWTRSPICRGPFPIAITSPRRRSAAKSTSPAAATPAVRFGDPRTDSLDVYDPAQRNWHDAASRCLGRAAA